jgi:hypothetical protein
VGWGDELMASGQAKRAQETDPRRVQILGADGIPRWHPAWAGNPRIARADEVGDFQQIVNGPNARPYIAGKTPECWTWRDYEPVPGEIYFTNEEARFGSRNVAHIIIAGSLKPSASPNKQWGKWKEFAALAKAAGLGLTQLGGRPIPYCRQVQTTTFRDACAVLSTARAFVGNEGGLHHAAAALGIPGVVIFGGFISPRQTGYKMHRNIFTGGEPCGMRVPCRHCSDAMNSITPERVLQELLEVI